MTPPAVEDRPYQRDMLEAVTKALLETGTNRILCKSPTGTGKTVTFARMLQWPDLKRWIDTHATRARGHKGCTMLVIAHREELLDQAAAQIQRLNPGIMVSIEQGERRANSYSEVVVASIQTLAKNKFTRLKRLLERHSPRVVIVDEAHHSAASTYRGALALLGFLPPMADDQPENYEGLDDEAAAAKLSSGLAEWDKVAPKDRVLVGVTATPNRSDAIGLGCVFQTLAYSYALKQAIDDGWLVSLTPWLIETGNSLEGVGISRGDFNQRQLAEAVNTDARNRLALKGWLDYAAGLSTLGFTVDVAHAHAMAELFRNHGIEAVALSGETDKDERRAILRAYTAGEITVIFNCMVLTEGTDLPRTACILHLKPTKSATLYEQMTGRGLRVHPDDPAGPKRLQHKGPVRKSECVVIDLVDVARRHSLQTAPVLYGLPPKIKANGKSLKQLENEWEGILEKHPNFDIGDKLQTLEEIVARAQKLDVWTIQGPAFGYGRALDWMKLSTDRYALRYPWGDGEEVIRIEPDLIGKFAVSCTMKPTDGSAPRQRTIAAGVSTAEAAAGLAEAFVLQERRAAAKMQDPNAAWRGNLATEKQIRFLQRLRVPVKPGLTSGEASKLIDMAQAARGRM